MRIRAWLSRRFGLTIDNLLSAEVVTADGARLTASESANADLFWTIRGGGGNFGIVTSFEFRLHPVGPQVFAGLVVHPLVAAREVLAFRREYMKQTPEELTCWFVMRQAPPLPAVPVEFHGKEILALAVCHSGSMVEAERLAKPLREFGRPVADMVAPQPYAEWQTLLDPLPLGQNPRPWGCSSQAPREPSTRCRKRPAATRNSSLHS